MRTDGTVPGAPRPGFSGRLLKPWDRVLQPADRVLQLAFGLVGLAFGLQPGVAHHLADGLLDRALGLLGG
jgi:hypothetical protein